MAQDMGLDTIRGIEATDMRNTMPTTRRWLVSSMQTTMVATVAARDCMIITEMQPRTRTPITGTTDMDSLVDMVSLVQLVIDRLNSIYPARQLVNQLDLCAWW